MFMEFFKKLFGKKEPKEIKTNMDLLPSILENNLTAQRKELEMESAKKMSELKYLFEKVKLILNEVKGKNLESKSNEKLNKAAITAKIQMEKQLEKTLEKINPNIESKNLENTYSYSKESFVYLFNEINSYRKSIVYTSIYLKDEMKNLGENLQNILNKLKEMNDLFDSKKEIFLFEKIKQNIEGIKKDYKEIESKKEKINSVKLEINNLEKEILNEENNILKLVESDESKDLTKIKEKKNKLLNEKQSLKVELMSMLSTVDKPLQRFLSLIESGRWKIETQKKELLKNFLTNPIVALRSDISGEKIKEILKEVIDAINDEKIELKEKEKEKKLDALQELIAFDYFGKIFWKVNEIQKELSKIDAQINQSEVTKDINNKERETNELKKEVDKKNEEITNLENQINSLNNKIMNEKNKISNFAKNVLNKKIIIE